MKRSLVLAIGFTLVFAAAGTAAGEVWTVDPVHSTAQFTARHFGIVPVVGTIPIVRASVTLGASDNIPTAVSADLDASRVDTHNDSRDGELKSDHFFNVAQTPDLHFASTKIEGSDPKKFTIAGNLTMHGETHPLVLAAQVVASGTSPRGSRIIAYGASASIDRTRWGMTYGPMIVGNNIDIAINIEADEPRR